ncbi:MAG: thiamine-phosphate kinase [Candidatus Nanopelagicales bacterium]
MAESVGDLGELALVERIIAAVGAPARRASVILGPGDDAAVLAAPDERVVVTTDVLVEGRHFRRDWSSAEDVGVKAAAENLADIAAMGAQPTGLVVGLAMPPETEVAWVDGLLAGLVSESKRAGAALVGGDVVRADTVFLSVTALGDLQGRPPVLRSGAKAGDVVAVSGRLGCAAAGLAVLSRGFRSPRALVDAHRRPEPDYAAGIRAAESGAHALMDVSDGLLIDAGRMARASGVDIDIDADVIPMDEVLLTTASAYNLDPLLWILGGGDDHAMLATFPRGRDLPAGFAAVGVVAKATGDGPTVTVDGKKPSQVAGFEHFRS